jgi:hypothetical protein
MGQHIGAPSVQELVLGALVSVAGVAAAAFGLYALQVGRIRVSRSKSIQGPAARIAAVMLVAAGAGFVIYFMLFKEWYW